MIRTGRSLVFSREDSYRRGKDSVLTQKRSDSGDLNEVLTTGSRVYNMQGAVAKIYSSSKHDHATVRGEAE